MRETTQSLVTPGIDFYTYIHKSFRSRLFDASVSAGRVDWTQAEAVEALGVTIGRLFDDLEEHAAHEKAFWHPLIARVNPDAVRSLDDEHAQQDHQLQGLRAMLAAASAGDIEAGREFYRAFNAFTGGFLLHLAEEETGNPLLWAAYRGGELEGAYHAFKLTIPFDESLRYLETMLPAMNPQDRGALMASLEGAPAAVVEAVRQLGERLIGPSAWREPVVA